MRLCFYVSISDTATAAGTSVCYHYEMILTRRLLFMLALAHFQSFFFQRDNPKIQAVYSADGVKSYDMDKDGMNVEIGRSLVHIFTSHISLSLSLSFLIVFVYAVVLPIIVTFLMLL